MTIVQYVLVSCRLPSGGLYVFINSTRWFCRSLLLTAMFIIQKTDHFLFGQLLL